MPVKFEQWSTANLDIYLSSSDAHALLDRARRWDVDSGGRFDVRSERTIILWSAEVGPDGDREKMVGAISLRWRGDDVTVWRIAWDELGGTTETELRHAVDLLCGHVVGDIK